MINQIPDVPMDDYLQKELERQREEELAGTGTIEFPEMRRHHRGFSWQWRGEKYFLGSD